MNSNMNVIFAPVPDPSYRPPRASIKAAVRGEGPEGSRFSEIIRVGINPTVMYINPFKVRSKSSFLLLFA